MSQLMEITGRGIALIIILLFLLLVYMKVRRHSLSETWDEIYDWVGKK